MEKVEVLQKVCHVSHLERSQAGKRGFVSMTTSKSESSKWERVGCIRYSSPRPENVRDLWDQRGILSPKAHSVMLLLT